MSMNLITRLLVNWIDIDKTEMARDVPLLQHCAMTYIFINMIYHALAFNITLKLSFPIYLDIIRVHRWCFYIDTHQFHDKPFCQYMLFIKHEQTDNGKYLKWSHSFVYLTCCYFSGFIFKPVNCYMEESNARNIVPYE